MAENMNGAEILGAQTLRNLSSGATFLASAMITTFLLLGNLMTQSASSITSSGTESNTTVLADLEKLASETESVWTSLFLTPLLV